MLRRPSSVELALRRLEPLGVERLDRLGSAPDERLGVLMRLEVGQHVVREVAPVAAAGPADADAEAQEVRRAEVLRHRAEPVVAREAAAAPSLQAPELEIALVVDDEDRVRLDLVELRRGLDRAAGLVHVRLRLQQADLVAVDPDVGELPRELALPGRMVSKRELVDDHMADVVAVVGVLAAGIAEPDDQQVERGGALTPAPGETHLGLAGFGFAALFRGGLRTLG